MDISKVYSCRIVFFGENSTLLCDRRLTFGEDDQAVLLTAPYWISEIDAQCQYV